MVIADHEGLVTLVNSQTEKLFGYAREALLGKSLEMLVPERLRSKHRQHRSGYAANPTVRPMGIGLELFGRHKDGSEFPIEISLSPFETDEGQFVSSTIRDITDRKRAQEALQELSARLIEAQEEERSRIARELHDDTSQRLALLAIELEQLGQHPPKSTAQLRERAQALCGRTQDIASEIHNLSRQLHPSILDELGLVTAVRSYCGEISRQHGIEIIFNHDDVSSSISKSVSLCLYRIVQEAVQNVIKHSRAQKAQIELAERSGVLHLRVSDSGVGFDINSLQGKGGLGLVSMRERLRLVGGKLSIRSHPSQGTQIEVQVPLSSAA
jgi:PAS domain S-box-containing protein